MKTLLLVLLVLVVVVSCNHVRYNMTASMPVGAYWRTSSFNRGDTVEVCAPNPIVDEGLAKGYIPRFPFGPCHGHTVPLVKVLAAVGGDVVDVSSAGISIDGALWPHSQRRYVTRTGERITRWLPTGRFRMPAARVLVLGQHPESWDSRTFGTLPASCVRARWRPLLTTASLGGS